MTYYYKTFLVLSLLLLLAHLSAQDKVTLSGKVLAENFSPLVNAGIYVQRYAIGYYTDSTGSFKIQLAKGECELSISYVGYRTEKVALNLTHDTLIELHMKTNLQLKEVVVVDKQQLKAADHNPDGIISLRKENFLSLPAMLGENDPIKAVMMQPGVQSGNEGANGIYIQGGSPDQTLILLDGATVFNPSHIYGIISVFNSDAIDKIDVYKNTYPAQFGGRLGSVLDISSGDGSSQNLSGTFAIGIVTSRFHLEGPLDKSNNTTFSISARGSFIGLLTEPISARSFKSDGITGGVSYYFEDINARLTHRFSKKDQLSFSFFQNKDFYSYEDGHTSINPGYTFTDHYAQNVDWANYVVALLWTHQFSEKWKWTNNLSFSDYIFTPGETTSQIYNWAGWQQPGVSFSQYKELSYVRQYSFQSEATYSPGKIQTIKFGAGCDQQQFETGSGNATSIEGFGTYDTVTTPLNKEIINPIEAYAFIQDEIKPIEKLPINAGVRAQNYTVNGKDFFSFLPRLNIAYTLIKNFTILTSVSGLMQDLHLLTPSSTNVLNDNWVPATRTAPPETGWNYTLGVIQKLPFNFEWSVDGFYRSMKNLIDYADGADYSFEQSEWEKQIVTGGMGRSYGLETYVARSFGRITGSIKYTLAWSDRRFADLNEGNWFPYAYDRRHDVAMQANYLLNKHIEFGAEWVYGSGNMTTLPIANYNTYDALSSYQQYLGSGASGNTYTNEITAYTSRNTYRLPSYQHLDISFTYKKRVKKLEHRFNFSVYNVYNHFNVFGLVSISSSGANGATIQNYKELSLFPVLPSLSYTLKFGLI